MDMEQWITINKLKLDRNKTELLVLILAIGRRAHLILFMLELSISLHQLHQQEITASGSTIWCLWMNRLLLKSAFYHLHNIAKIKKFISFQHCETLIHEFITSKLDYCNSVLSGVSKNQTQRLQDVQNSAARLLTGTSQHDKIHYEIKTHENPVKFFHGKFACFS